MENIIEIVSVPVIAGAVYGAVTLIKKAVKCDEKVMKFLPLISAGLGIIFGIIAFFAAPEIIAADNVLTAILVGGASGLAATGTHQAFKQLLQKGKEKLLTHIKKDDKEDGDGTKSGTGD